MSVTVSDGALSAMAGIAVMIADSDSACRRTDPRASGYPLWAFARAPYVAGDRVAHQGLVWEARYWTQEEPLVGATDWPSDWTLISDNVELSWNAERVYLPDDRADYGARRYRARWWTRGDDPAVGATRVWADSGPAVCP